MTRYSTSTGDPGHGAYLETVKRGEKMRVMLDGEEVNNVHTADEERGMVLVHAVNDDGVPYEALLVIMRGKVDVWRYKALN